MKGKEYELGRSRKKEEEEEEDELLAEKIILMYCMKEKIFSPLLSKSETIFFPWGE